MTSHPRLARALVTSLFLSALATGCLPRRAYDPCVVNADCPATTQCLTITADSDRICTTSCTTDASCPNDRFGTDGRCISFDSGANFTCWQGCALGGGGSECPVGYDCFDQDATGRTFPPICLPSRGPSASQRAYEPCTSTSQCLGGLSCVSINTSGDSMCTDFCTTDSSCALDRFGSSARCLSFDGGGVFSCFQACNVSAGGSECPGGYGCFDTDGVSSFPPICLPN